MPRVLEVFAAVAGARFVWFDCPVEIARKRYAKRENYDVAKLQAFKQQVELTTERRQDILTVADPQIIQVMRGKAPRSHADLYEDIFGAAPETD
jgi:hypothetical protein